MIRSEIVGSMFQGAGIALMATGDIGNGALFWVTGVVLWCHHWWRSSR